MKRLLAIIPACLLVAASCKSDSDVLAAYKGGAVTRGEFRAWLNYREKSGEGAEPEKLNLKKELQLLALHRIAAIEAKKENYENSGRFRFLMEDIETRHLCTMLLDREFKKRGFSAEAVKLRQILVPVEGDAAPVLENARRIIAELDRGAPFAEMVKKHSLHPSKNKDGDIGWFIREMLPPLYADAAFSMKKGAHSPRPLYLPDLKSVGIILVEDRALLTPDTLGRLVKEPRTLSLLHEHFYGGVRESLARELADSGRAVFNEAAASSNDPGALIYTAGDARFTVNDLRARIETMKEIMGHKITALDDAFKKRMAREHFQDRLLKTEALKRGLDREPEYRALIDETRDRYLAGDYMEYVAAREMKVTPEEIRKEYERNRETRYSTVVRTNGRQVRKPRPFGEVKGLIEHTLKTLKEMDAREGWMRKMLGRYEFTIIDRRILKEP